MAAAFEVRNPKKRIKSSVLSMVFALAVVAFSIVGAIPVWAVDTGTYLVTVRPSYVDPETGKVDDPGNNEAIGQGMCERMCGAVGLLEVDASGTMYLTVRYYLSQFIKDVTFEERIGTSYTFRTFQQMQTKAPVDGASDISEKYGYTDYRIPISGVDSVFRGNAYIDAMGRSVVYFFTVSNPVSGSGDFVTSIQSSTGSEQVNSVSADTTADQPEETKATAELREQTVTGERKTDSDETEVITADFDENGIGESDDPVTGIPEKPGKVTAGEDQAAESYHLQSIYDSDVPLGTARELTEPMLAAAVGITAMTGTENYQVNAAALAPEGQMSNSNKSIMKVLLAVAAVLMICFGHAAVMQRRNRPMTNREKTEAEEAGK